MHRQHSVLFSLLLLALTWGGSNPSHAQTKTCGLPNLPACPGAAPMISPIWYDVVYASAQHFFDSKAPAIALPPSLAVRGPGSYCTMTFSGDAYDPPQKMYNIDYYWAGSFNYNATAWDPECNLPPFTPAVAAYKQLTITCPNGDNPVYSWQTPQIAAYCPAPTPAPPAPKYPLKAAGECKDCTKGGASAGSGKDVVGNPVDISNGNKHQVETDYVGNGPNPLRFQRGYNSFSAYYVGVTQFNSNQGFGPQPLGPAWTATYFQRLVRSTTTASQTSFDTIYALRPDGRLLTFNLYNGVYNPDADVVDRVSITGSGYEYRTANDTVEQYDADGRLTSITPRGGATQQISYNGDDPRPSSVSDPFGHTLTFTYAADATGTPRLQTLVDPAGNTTSYAYHSNGGLASVTYPDTRSRAYAYGHTGWTLTQLTDEANVAFATWTYTTGGQFVTGSSHAGGVESYTISYSGSSRTVTDPLGVSRNYGESLVQGVYRGSGVSVLCPGCVQARTYDTNGNVLSQTDFNNVVTTAAYEVDRNLPTSRTEAFGTARARTTTTAWHANFRLPTSIVEPNRTTAFTHDSSGRLLTRTVTDTSVTPNVSRTWTYTYNSFGQVLTEDGPRTDVTDVTTYTYYTCTTGFQCGQLKTITNALGHVTTYNSYNAHGQATQITDANGLVTSLSYDLRQRLTDRCVGATLPSCTSGELTHLEYFPTGLLKKMTNPDASYIEYTYDAAHRLTQINDGASNKIGYTLDNAGNRTAENTYDPGNSLRRTHTRVFNTLNQLWKDVNAASTAGVTTVFGYDNNGNPTTTNAPLSRNSTSLYDELNRLKQITDPASEVTQFGYDANDNLMSVTDPRSLVTSYTYTGFGDLKTQTSPDTGVTTSTYDSGGNLDTSIDSRGAVTDYGYDAANRVTSASFTLSGVTDQTITYVYDTGTNQKGHLTGASDASHTLAWTYDPRGRITGFGQTVGGTTLAIGYGYDSSGRLANTVLTSGATIAYGYNANGQVTSLTLNGSTAILNSITYDPFGPITGWTWGNSTTASRAFDTDGKVTQVDNANGASLKNFSYDDAFRITGIADAGSSALSWTYGYDALDRLNAATKTGTTQGWSYDANGNRLTETGSSPSTYTTSGSSNRVSSIAGSLPRTYAYDAAGNTLCYVGATFTYNHRGRMTSATNGGVTATYTYNALGQRIKRTASGVTTLYAYDEAGHLAGEYTSVGALIQETVWLGDLPVATLRPNGSGGVILYYVHADHLNTPRLVTDLSNNIRWRWDSDPFGTTQPNENPSSLGNFTYNLRFPGQQYDPAVGLHYNYFRDYDPGIGRYVESDPIGLKGGPNTYLYADARSLEVSDPRGLNPATGAVWGGNAGTAIGGILGGPPGAWIGRVIGTGIGAGLGYLVVKCLKDEPETCQDHYAKCLTSGWGGQVGYGSACQACFDRCRGSGTNTWPDSVISGKWGQIVVYCDYWSKKRN